MRKVRVGIQFDKFILKLKQTYGFEMNGWSESNFNESSSILYTITLSRPPSGTI